MRLRWCPLMSCYTLFSIAILLADSARVLSENRFKRFMLEHMGVQDIPMERNRVLFVSRATAVKNHKPYRQILNEVCSVCVLGAHAAPVSKKHQLIPIRARRSWLTSCRRRASRSTWWTTGC